MACIADKLEIVVKYHTFDIQEGTQTEIKKQQEERIPIEITRPYRFHKVRENTIEDKTIDPATDKPKGTVLVIGGKTYNAGKSETNAIETSLSESLKVKDLVGTCSVEFYREDASDSNPDIRFRQFIEAARIALKDKPIQVEMMTLANSNVDTGYNSNSHNKYTVFRVIVPK